jgi:hypothetical protein
MTQATRLTQTRHALTNALEELVASATPELQAKLAEALEKFASYRGQERYGMLLDKQPLFADLAAAIEEGSDARLFISEKMGETR